MRRILFTGILVVMLLTSGGCKAKIDTDALSVTLWYMAKDAIMELVDRELGIDFDNKFEVVEWTADKMGSFDPEENFTKYVNMDILISDAYDYVNDKLNEMMLLSPGSDVDIYDFMGQDTLIMNADEVRYRLKDVDVFK